MSAHLRHIILREGVHNIILREGIHNGRILFLTIHSRLRIESNGFTVLKRKGKKRVIFISFDS